ncbi:MAG: hypothetical protein IKI42_02980 [Clostridia bacterium]|nr:hypothetical protein [Clostridia bacterium]
MSKNKMVFIASLVCVVCAALLVVSLFLPFTKANKDEAESIMSRPAYKAFDNDKLNYTSHDLVRISLFKYTRIYGTLGEELWGDKISGIFYIAIFVLLAAFAALTLLFSALKKPVAIIVFDVLFFALTLFNNSDYTSRRVISENSSYQWGIAHTLFFVLTAIILAGAIAMIVFKMQEKKQMDKNGDELSAQALEEARKWTVEKQNTTLSSK